MASWEDERRKVWGLLLELKQRIRVLEMQNKERKEALKQPPKAAEA